MKKLGFGFMRLPLLNKDDQTSFDYERINRLVDTFLEKGFTYFDTALTYHGGLSEQAIRKSLTERHPRESFTLATKLPPRVLNAKQEQPDIFEGQLKRCGVEYFDYYLVHNLGQIAYKQAEQFDTFGFVRQMKKEGKIKNIGLSFHDVPELLEEILDKYGRMLDFVQLQINYADWENPGIQSRRCWEVARSHGLPIVVMEPLKGGNLAQVPEKAEKLMKEYNPDASAASWAMRYAAGKEGVFMALSGMNAMEQVLDNASYMAEFIPLNEKEEQILARVAEIIEEDTAVPCTTCRYCEDGCPKKIAIPDYFALFNNAKRAVTGNGTSQFVYYLNLAATHGKASDCIACGKCEKACPQHIKIIDALKDVAAQFEGKALPTKKA